MHEKSSIDQQSIPSPELLQKTLRELLEQISKRDQKVLSITAEKMALMRVVVEKDQMIAEKEASLRFTEGELDKIRRSKAWKIASILIEVRSSLFPPNSRRAQVLDKALNLVLSPFKQAGKN